ncbi:hypothetical protein N2W52_001958 [Clostridium perfringens]|nr:hypothetical protein [Clostridium perfringens]MDK0982973.1 hypothetical protein [Clostridium perfringens]
MWQSKQIIKSFIFENVLFRKGETIKVKKFKGKYAISYSDSGLIFLVNKFELMNIYKNCSNIKKPSKIFVFMGVC